MKSKVPENLPFLHFNLLTSKIPNRLMISNGQMSKSALGKNLSAETSGTVSRRSLVSYSPVAAVVKKRPLAFYKLTKPGSPSRAVGDGSLFVRDAACVY